jgi:VanZ family protein
VSIPPVRTLIHFVFGAYAGALFLATHWPNVQIHGPIPRPDIVIHVTVFGTWNALMIGCGLFGARFSTRNIGRSTLISLLYAAIDEGLQAIPFVHRHAAVDDYGANAAGIVLVAAISFVIGRVCGGARQRCGQP